MSSVPTLGLFFDRLESGYRDSLLQGAMDAAREAGARLICFAGGALHPPSVAELAQNTAYDLAGPETLDGLAMLSAPLSYYLRPAAFLAFWQRYKALPMVSIAVELPGVPSLQVDNQTGMRALIEHLIEAHGHRRIAFIRGPESNAEAEQRYRIYQDVLEAHDLPFDSNLVVSGDFFLGSGTQAIHLLERRKVKMDAVVAANDMMAVGALQALQSLGVHIPDQVAVVGFDDLDVAVTTTPPLTTVRQPTVALGRRAVELLLAQLRGETTPERVLLATELITRQSCGCLARPSTGQADQRLGTARLFEAAMNGRREGTLAEMRHELGDLPSGATGPEQLFESFVADVTGRRAGAFLTSVDLVLRSSIGNGDLGVWQGALSALRRNALPCLNNPRHAARAEEIWHQARVLIGEAAQRLEVRRLLEQMARTRALHEVMRALIAVFDVPQLMDVLSRNLGRVGIERAFVVLYQDPTRPADLAHIHLALGVPDRMQAEAYPSRQLIPGGLRSLAGAGNWILTPLTFGERSMGFALFESGPRETAVYDVLRGHLSSALQAARLLHEGEELLTRLRGETQQVEQIEQAYRALQENQAKLLVTEKMASLGRLTAGIAHEMNTPLAAVRAALAETDRLVKEYLASIDDATITAEDHREIVREMQQALELADRAAQKAAGFVRSIKFQTRDLAPSEHIHFDPQPVIQDTLLLLGHALRQAGCTVHFSANVDGVELLGSPARLAQIVTNLVLNAIDASQGGERRAITLQLAADNPAGLTLRVHDQGAGISQTDLTKIFDPMFTTKPLGQGTGLGLSIVHDIVTGDFGGTIEVQSKTGEGTTFTIRFPGTTS